MKYPYASSWFHLCFAGLSAALVSAAALGQATGMNAGMYGDQFVQMRTNLGQEMHGYAGYQYSPLQSTSQGYPWYPYYRESDDAMPLPPPPPALGDDLPYARYAGASGFTATDVSREIFYGPYAALVYRNTATLKQIERVAAYRRSREQVLREIDAKCDQLHEADPTARATALAELAREQEPRLQALEAEAEAIRSDLAGVDVGFELITTRRISGLDYQRAIQQSTAQFHAMYQYPGLSIEQRLLIPELAYDVQSRVGNNLVLLPATSWIRLPPNVPAPLEAKIAQFVAEKERLKSELRDAVRREYYYFSFHRGQRLSTLATDQAPRFAALENLAEEIRVGLAQMNGPNPIEPATLPAELTRRVADFSARKQELQREVAGRLRRLRVDYPDTHFQIALNDDTLAILPTGGAKKTPADLAEFNASLTSRYVALARDTEALRRDITLYSQNHRGQITGGVDEVATEFLKAYTAREKWSAYREYYRAVLEPGLSPPQRRLLFQAAVENLDQAGWLPRR